MDQDTIQELLNLGEYDRLECKTAAGGLPKSTWETYSAFANTSGGTILLGVEERREIQGSSYRVVGVPDAASRVRDIWNTVNNPSKVNRNVLSSQDVGVTRIDGADVVWIQVPAVIFSDRPIYLGSNPLTGTFKRNHEGDHRCSEDEVRRMYRDCTPKLDSELLPEYTLDDLDLASVQAYRNQFKQLHEGHTWNGLSDDAFLRMLRACRRDSDAQIGHLTVAGLLMFGKGEAVQDCFPTFMLDYIDKANTPPDVRWNDRVVFDGTWELNLYNFAAIVMPKITRDIEKSFQMNGVIREDDTPIHKAVREALINMLVHCDYRAGGVAVATKDNHGFTFRNPGTPLIPVQDVYAGGVTWARNPLIQTMFRLIGFGESIGSGFPTILEAWQNKGWRLPDLSENRSTLSTDLRLWTLPAVSAELEKVATAAIEGYAALSALSRQIVLSLLAEGTAATDRLARLINKSRNQTLRLLADLQARQIVSENAADQWSLCTAHGSTADVAETSTGDDPDQRVYAALKENRSMSSKQLSSETGCSIRTVQRSLKGLLASGQVAQTRSGSSVVYFLTAAHSDAAAQGAGPSA